MDMKFRPLDDKNHAQKYFSFVFVISKLLKHRWKAKRRAPAFSRALRQINPEAIVHGKFGGRIDRIAVKAGVVMGEEKKQNFEVDLFRAFSQWSYMRMRVIMIPLRSGDSADQHKRRIRGTNPGALSQYLTSTHAFISFTTFCPQKFGFARPIFLTTLPGLDLPAKS